MTAQQAATTLLNQNFRPDLIIKTIQEIEKNAVASSAPTVSR